MSSWKLRRVTRRYLSESYCGQVINMEHHAVCEKWQSSRFLPLFTVLAFTLFFDQSLSLSLSLFLCFSLFAVIVGSFDPSPGTQAYDWFYKLRYIAFSCDLRTTGINNRIKYVWVGYYIVAVQGNAGHFFFFFDSNVWTI